MARAAAGGSVTTGGTRNGWTSSCAAAQRLPEAMEEEPLVAGVLVDDDQRPAGRLAEQVGPRVLPDVAHRAEVARAGAPGVRSGRGRTGRAGPGSAGIGERKHVPRPLRRPVAGPARGRRPRRRRPARRPSGPAGRASGPGRARTSRWRSQGDGRSASLTAWWTASVAARASWNRTSSFWGWTFTSTRSSGSSRKSTPAGCRPAGSDPA